MNLKKHGAPQVPYPASPVSQEPNTGSGHYPNLFFKTGLVLSIHTESKGEVAATVTHSSSEEICLELAKPDSQLPFGEGERVRIQYWDEGPVAFFWDAKVVKILGTPGQQVAVWVRSEGVTAQGRKSYRVRARIPLFLTVIDAAVSQLVGEHFVNFKTQNIGVGGLEFETNLPLKARDKLALKVHFEPSCEIDAVGSILRSKQVEREGEKLNSVALEFLQCDSQDQRQLLQSLASA